ncbi:hypothetical protein ACVWWN_000334 [Mycobacterium sp. URHB0021]
MLRRGVRVPRRSGAVLLLLMRLGRLLQPEQGYRYVIQDADDLLGPAPCAV